MSVKSLSQQKLSLNVFNKRGVKLKPAFKAANSGQYNTLTVASHAVGDLMLAMGWGAFGNAVPVFSSGDFNTPSWTLIGSPAYGVSMYYAIATKTNHTFGTWTYGSYMTSITISSPSGSPIGLYSYDNGNPTASLTSSGTSTASTSVTGGTNSLVLYYGYSVNTWTAASGFTTLHDASPLSSYNVKLLSRNDPTTAPSSNVFGTQASTYWAGSALEIK